ncbi:MAG: sugar phosphate isomerase/epimerase [Phycisphaeraceae bacterium]|nr:sugar phosphate isomerase/epimerase [Phycisphaeraceae bacterium]
MSQLDIRIGTIAPAGKAVAYLPQIIPHGFESFSLSFWRHVDAGLDLKSHAKAVCRVLRDTPSPNDAAPVISSLGIFGNPLEDKQTAKDWARCIDAARDFGCDIVAGFAGCVSGKPVNESYKAFGKVFRPLAKRAKDRGVRLAFENCDMGGWWHTAAWNIAHSPTAWEAMFNEVPEENIGLEWEPCHQMVSLIDPLPQLRQWAHKVFHVHGKDATVMWDVIRTKGIRGGVDYVYHRTPGFGDTNWTDVISILRLAKFKGAIDIEGWHDPVYQGELEMTGQVHGLNYLKTCRGGLFVPMPSL